MEGIEVIPIKQKDVKDAYVIDGFPSVGLVGSIAANYLVSYLDLELMAVMDATSFPALSLIREGIPNNPVRVYGGEIGENKVDKLVVFVSEFQPPTDLVKPLASIIMDWVEFNRCKMVISPEGMVIPPREEGEAEISSIEFGKIYGVGSTPRASKILNEHGIEKFGTGIILGLAGVLLNEGLKRDFDVVALLSWAHVEYPDARAAAACISAIDKILLHTELDTKPLIEEAELIENQLKEIYADAGKQQEISKSKSIMYG
jgi:uncharacterized protein